MRDECFVSTPPQPLPKWRGFPRLSLAFLYIENQIFNSKFHFVHNFLFIPKLSSLPAGEGKGGAKKSGFLI
jgi:hypothetical protein